LASGTPTVSSAPLQLSFALLAQTSNYTTGQIFRKPGNTHIHVSSDRHWASCTSVTVFKFALTLILWRAEGGRRTGPAPGIQSQGGIQSVKLQKLKCCNWMIFPIVSQLIHAAWIWFYETCFVVNTNIYVF